MAIGILIPSNPIRSVRERLAELLDRFSYADSFRQQYERRGIENYKLYVGYRPPLPPEKEGRSNLHIPMAYEAIDTLRGRIHQAFCRTRPYVDFVAVPSAAHLSYMADPQQVQMAEEQAKLAAALVDNQLEKNNWEAVLYDYLTSLLIFPAAILSVGWRFDQKRVRRRVPRVAGLDLTPLGEVVPRIVYDLVETLETAWDDNEVTNVDFSNFWIDPRGTNIDNARFCFQREWMTRDDLENLQQVLAASQSGDVFQLDYEALGKVGDSYAHEGPWTRMAEVGISADTGSGNWPEDHRRGDLYEVLHYWEDERHAIIVNRAQLAFDGMNPYWRHSKKPFVFQSWEPLPNEPYGLSAMDILRHLQEELNTTRNQRIDNVSMVLNRMWKVRRGADIDDSELVSRPHGIIRVDRMEDVEPLLMPDVTASSYQEERTLRQDMENALGVPGLIRGVHDQQRQTATEATIRNTSAGIRFDVKIILFDTLGLKRMAELMDLNNQQFITMPRAIKVFGADEAMSWKMITPDQIIGEHEYRPGSSAVDPTTNKEVRRQQLTQALAIVLQTNLPYVDKYELVKAWLETFDIRNVERLLIPKDVLLQQLMAVQQMQGQSRPAAAPMPGNLLPGLGAQMPQLNQLMQLLSGLRAA